MIFFKAIIDGDKALLERVSCYQGQLEFSNGVLCFTLVGLYDFLSVSGSFSYEQFRRTLYAGTINTQLRKLGFSVDIHLSTRKVDSTWYKLVETDRIATF